jgi:hypothetical protein
MDYIILVSSNSQTLSLEVTAYLKKGYELYGNPFCTDRAFFQEVIKNEKEGK